MEDEALEAGSLRGAQYTNQIACRHRIARVRIACSRNPAKHLVHAGGFNGPARFAKDDTVEKLVGETGLQVKERLHPGQFDAEEPLNHRKGVFFAQARIPLSQRLNPTGHSAVQAVETAMPIIVFGQYIIEIARHLLVVLTRQPGEDRRARNAAQLDFSRHLVNHLPRLNPGAPRPLLPHAQPIEPILIEVNEVQHRKKPPLGQIAHPLRRQTAQTLPQMLDTAMHPREIDPHLHVDVIVLGLTDFQ